MNKKTKQRNKNLEQQKERVLSLLRVAQFNAGVKTDSVKLIREERGWTKLTTEQFFAGYSDADEIYDKT